MAVALWGDRQVASVNNGGTDRGIGYIVRGFAQQGRKGYPEPGPPGQLGGPLGTLIAWGWDECRPQPPGRHIPDPPKHTPEQH